MIQRTLGEARTLLADIAGISGYSSTDSRMVTAINRATEELLKTGDYPSVVDRYKVRVTERLVTLPYYLDRILGVAVDKQPYEMRRPWIEFDQYGPGTQDEYTGVDIVLDKEDAPIFRDIPNVDGRTYVLKLDSEGIEAGTEQILVKGYDDNGDWIRSEYPASSGTYIDGVYMTVDTIGTQRFSEIISIVKDSTKGVLTLSTRDDLSVNTVIGIYQPNELVPSYRRYYLPFLADDNTYTIRMRARKRYVPVVNDNDLLLIPNIDALENMILAQQKRRAQEIQDYMAFKNLAIANLKEEAKSYNGYSQSPVIKLSQGFGVGDFENII